MIEGETFRTRSTTDDRDSRKAGERDSARLLEAVSSR